MSWSQFLLWLRQLLPSVLATISISVVALETDSIEGDPITIESASDLTATATADDLTLTAGDLIAATGANDVTLTATADDLTLTAGDLIAATGANDVTLTATADDLTLTAGDDVLVTAPGGMTVTGELASSFATGLLGNPILTDTTGAEYLNAQTAGTATYESLAQRDFTAASWISGASTIRVRAWGLSAANTNTRSFSLRYGTNGTGCGSGSLIGSNFGLSLSTQTIWRAEWLIQRTGVSTQRYMVEVVTDDSSGTSVSSHTLGTGTITAGEAAAVEFNLCVYTPTATTDFTLLGWSFELTP